MNIPALVAMSLFFAVPGLLALGQTFLSSSVGGAIVGLILTVFFLGMALFFVVIARRQAVMDKFLEARPNVRRPAPRSGFKKAFLITFAVLFIPVVVPSFLSLIFMFHGILIAVGASAWVGWMNAMWQNTKHPMPAAR